MLPVAAALDELHHGPVGLGGRHAVEVAAAGRRLIAAFQSSDLAPVDAWRGEIREIGSVVRGAVSFSSVPGRGW
jgi:hypothetical protein